MFALKSTIMSKNVKNIRSNTKRVLPEKEIKKVRENIY